MIRNATLAGVLACTLLVTGCGKKDDEPSSRRVTAVDIREESPANKFGYQEARPENIAVPAMRSAADIAPGINPAAAPGVAFNYRYAFVLPDNAIAAVQEQHASACEKLGPSQCRIIGMRYTLVDEDRVEALLQLKLSPELARGFGKDGIAVVQKAEGKLVDAVIEGNDVGAQISGSQLRSAEVQTQIQRLEQQLKGLRAQAPERFTLQAQLEELRRQLQLEKSRQTDGMQQLANTPMTFTYAGQQGFALGRHPISDAGGSAWTSFVVMVSAILLGLGYGLPWLILLGLLWAVWRSRLCAGIRESVRRRNSPEIAPQAE